MADKTRTLIFPDDRTVGWVKIPKQGSDPQNNWELAGDAIGSVVVARETPVRLIVESSSARDLSWLQRLHPDDLSELILGQTYIRDAELTYVSSLTGLRVLSLAYPSGTISDAGIARLKEALPHCVIIEDPL